MILDLVNRKDDDNLEGGALATKVNQWMYHSSDGLLFPCNFYFNDGRLNATDCFTQLTQTVQACEAINRHVVGLNLDAGGSNASLVSSIAISNKIADDALILDDKHISFKHPLHPDKKIYFFFCATHGLKNLRNALLHSILGATRSLRDASDFEATWRVIEDLFNKSSGKEKWALLRAVNLTGSYEKMNVKYAKAILKPEVLAALASLILKGLDATEQEKKEVEEAVDRNDANVTLIQKGNVTEGKFLAWAVELRKFALSRATVPVAVREQIATYEYLAVLQEIFLSIFLNKHTNLTLENIDDMTSFLEERLNVLCQWKLAQTEKTAKSKAYNAAQSSWQRFQKFPSFGHKSNKELVNIIKGYNKMNRANLPTKGKKQELLRTILENLKPEDCWKVEEPDELLKVRFRDE